MPQAVTRRPLSVEARVPSQISECEICGAQSGTKTGFPPTAWFSPCHYHSTNAPYSSPSTCRPYQKDKRARPGNLPKNLALSDIR